MEDQLNDQPRISLYDLSAAEPFTALLAAGSSQRRNTDARRHDPDQTSSWSNHFTILSLMVQPHSLEQLHGLASHHDQSPCPHRKAATVAEAAATIQTEPESEKAMREAVYSAITGSEQEVRYLKEQIGKTKASLGSACKQAIDAFKEAEHDPDDSLTAASVAITDLLQGASDQIDDYFSRYEDVLKTFNIALFGRTGAGKSTLPAPLSR